jgi:hypothetical protein
MMNNGPGGQVGGDIFRFTLEDWWFSRFTDAERSWMATAYAPIGGGHRPLIEGDVKRSDHSPYPFLTGAAVWFSKEEWRHCAYAFLEKSDEFYSEEIPVIQRHFGMVHRLKVFYRWRAHDDFALEMAVETCKRAMLFHCEAALALEQQHKELGIMVNNPCLVQLVIIEEKRGNLETALSIAREAKDAGWQPADWDKRIASLERKLAKRA